MPKVIKNAVLDNKMWRYLANFWTLVLYVFVVWDFLAGNILTEFLGPVCAIYIAVLAVFSAEKEFERWHDYNIGRHPGEVYVFLWTVMIITLLVLEVLHYRDYVLPSEVFSTYIVVLGVLAVTRKSKTHYKRSHK